ncbi:MAG: hypothetical protein KDB21_13240 [Acidimicrobiales bacterium]|nr:hypothetical protein [Acidimicrobiales bacterium]
MRRKILAITAALAFGLLGTTMLIRFVRGAESRALADETLVDVYVVTTPISAGTSGSSMQSSVKLEQVPTKVRAVGAVTDLAAVGELVAAVDLVPGEQLVLGRLIEPESLNTRQGAVQAPEGYIELTLPFEPTRIVGGMVAPGDTVVIFASFEPFEIEGTDIELDGETIPVPPELTAEFAGKTPNTTGVLMHKVLITQVQVEEAPVANEDEDGNPTTGPMMAPTGSLLITFAISTPEAERLLFAQENGSLWAGYEPADAPETGTKIQTRATVYEDTTPELAK